MRRRPKTAVAIAALAIAAGACGVDTDIPTNALLTCLDDSHCPEAWICDPASAICLPPGGISPVDPELAEVRLAFCGALWDAAQPCPAELEEAMGESALVFALPRRSFLHVCSTNMLAETTIDDIGDLQAGAAVVPLLSCEGLASLMCEQLSTDDGPC